MIGGLSALILLTFLHTAEVPHLISLTTLELGGNATFHCPFSEKADRFFHWYKQSLGKMVQTVATVVYKKIELISPFNHTRFHVHKSNDQCVLTINHINKEDEATYFCQTGSEFLQHFVRGFFLAVNDYNHQTSVYVTQTPKSSSVQLGNTVTLQCSFLTKNKESSAQCPSDRSVHWFKSGSGENHPSIIYRNFTHSNNMDDTERRCIYHLSKTIQNLSDTGTYYCAVVTCGVILFGEGSKVDTSKYVQSLIS
uniref:Ig-like domain-containing protein n=1 Tax=Haplochromis burtoni TaxID=8153 RepID=A0A3Q2URX5_HAPBU